MIATLSIQDFQEANQAELRKLRDIADHGQSDGPHQQRFAAQVKAVEGLARTVYQCAALMARKTESLDETAVIWKEMVGFCDTMLVQLRDLAANHPDCNSQQLYDFTLDCRNAAARRMELHL